MCLTTSVAELLAEWNDSSFTTLKVMWSEAAVQGVAYMVTYVPVGNTVGLVDTSSNTKRTITGKDNNIVLTDLNPKEFYFLCVETIIPAVNQNNLQVTIGK